MYLWRIEKLKRELEEGPLPQVEQFKYLLASSLLVAGATIPMVSYNSHDTFNGLANVVLTPLGTYFIYHSNGKSGGDRLLEKYISLGFVTFIRLMAMFTLPILTGLVIVRMLIGIEHEGTDTVDSVCVLFSQLVYFYLLGRHVRHVATKQPHQTL